MSEKSPLRQCIYCGSEFDCSVGEGDHVISVQLGQFRDDLRFRYACQACNNLIGRSEQQFLQCSPIAAYREVVNPVVPKHRKRSKSRGSNKGAYGSPPPQKFSRLGGLEIEVRSINGNPDDVEPIDQIIINPSSDNPRVIPLFPGMRAEQLAKKLSQQDINLRNCEVYLSCNDAHSREYYELIRSQSPSADFDNLTVTEPFEERTAGRVKYVFGDHYFRVIAKIAFHHYLLYSRRGYIGNEEIFEPIRRFIMNGGDTKQFVDRVSFPTKIDLPYGPLPDGKLLAP